MRTHIFRAVACFAVLMLFAFAMAVVPETKAASPAPSAHATQKNAVAPAATFTAISDRRITQSEASNYTARAAETASLIETPIQPDTSASKAVAKRSRFDFKIDIGTQVDRTENAKPPADIRIGLCSSDTVLRL